MTRSLYLILVLVSAVGAQGALSILNADAPQFTLQDQYDKTVTSRQWEGRSVLFIAADKEGSEQNAPWKKAISERYGSRIVIQGIADLRSVPFFLKSRIKNDFLKSRESILLDWDGIVFTSYGLRKNVSNIILIDRTGIVRHVHSGPADPDAVGRLFRAVDRISE